MVAVGRVTILLLALCIVLCLRLDVVFVWCSTVMANVNDRDMLSVCVFGSL